MAHESRTLSVAKKRYTEMGKEILEIVFTCERFETYVYGRVMIRVKSDYKP